MNDPIHVEASELAAEASTWFEPADPDDAAARARLARVLASSTLLDFARPDRLNLVLVRTLAELPDGWDDAHVFAGVARVAADEAATNSDDEAYALVCLGAAREALLLAELVDAPKAATRRASEAKEQQHFERVQDLAIAWRRLGALPWKQKVPAVAAELGIHEKTVERLRAEANALGLPLAD